MTSPLEGLSAAAVADARAKQGVLPSRLRRLHGDGAVAGRVLTVACAQGSAAALLRALAETGPGDVLIIQGAGEWGYFGELAGAELVRRRARGVVVDGLLRDLERLCTLPLHLYAAGLTPQGAKPEGGGKVGEPLTIGGVAVATGDHVVGDADGVVVVPAREVDAVAARAREIEAAEAEVWDRVLSGGSLLDEPGQYGRSLREMSGGRA
jgi:regulator of RNase E activity RraA